MGAPVAKGRPKFRKVGKFVQAYTPAKTKKAELHIAGVFKEQLKRVPSGYDEIFLTCNFYMPIPKSISKKKAEQWHEKRGHTKRPDLDNLVKTVCDALNGVAFRDDSSIVGIQCGKLYSKEPRTEIFLEYLKNTP